VKIYCKIPKGGLGNKLFVISNALIYSRLINAKIVFIKSRELKIGPYLRKEKNKRKYKNFFKFKSRFFITPFQKNKIIEEPGFNDKLNEVSVFMFSKLPHWSIYFDKIRDYRNLCLQEIFNSLNDPIKVIIQSLENIDVAVHIRLGDFKKLQDSEDFSKVGSTRTPRDYFLNNINKIKTINPEYKFFIFSDGHESELDWILNEKNIFLYQSVNDIVDLYQMSKSKILITSAGSTYSYWAGFLGECQIIQHPDHVIYIR
jgi:hypothetical protein